MIKSCMMVTLILVVLACTAFYYFMPIMQPFPPLTGPFTIGTQSFYVRDDNREDPYRTGFNRELMVQCWYPTDAYNAQHYSYMEQSFDGIVEELKERRPYLPRAVIRQALTLPTHAQLNSPVSISQNGFPVIVVSHGFEGMRELYSVFTQELASHGYIVISIDHTSLAWLTVFPNGNVTPLNSTLNHEMFNAGLNREQKDKRFAPEFKECIPDIRFVIDQLEHWNSNQNHPLYKRLDLNRIALLGHSMGGVAALEACRIDNRCKAVVVMDYFNSLINSTERLAKPCMFLLGTEGIMVIDEPWINKQKLAMDQLCNNSSPYCKEVFIKGAGHLAFCDLILLKWPLAWLFGFPLGSGNQQTTLHDINRHLVNFFDSKLGQNK